MPEFPEVTSIWGPNPSCARGSAFQVNANPDGSKLVYGAWKNLVMRDMKDSSVCSVFSKHRADVTVAKFDKNGEQLASCDANGQRRLFNVAGNLLKEQEDKVSLGIGGRVNDMCWYPNNKGMAYVGDAKANNGRVCTLSGNDQGRIAAPKRLNSVDMFFFDEGHKQIKSGKILTGGDDAKLRVYRYDKREFVLTEAEAVGAKHNLQVNMVRFSPDGRFAVAVGNKDIRVMDSEADFKTLVYLKGDKKKSPEVHQGNITAVAWNRDGKLLFTSSTRKEVKLWAWNEGSKELKMLDTYSDFKSDFGEQFNDQQVGCCYAGTVAGDRFVSLSLSGDLHYFTVVDSSKLKLEQTVMGPTAEVNAMDVDSDGNVVVVTGKGEVLLYDKAGVASRVKGIAKPKRGVGVALLGDKIYYTGWEDKVTELGLTMSITDQVALSEQALRLNRGTGNYSQVAVTTKQTVTVYTKGSFGSPAKLNLPTGTSATCATISPDGSLLAVGNDKKEIKIYTLAGTSITENGVTIGPMNEEANCLKFSPDGSMIAAGCKRKYLMLYTLTGDEVKAGGWSVHSAMVTDIDFSPNGDYLLSSGLEGVLYIWDMKQPTKRFPMKQFPLSHPSGVAQAKWISDSTFYSVGIADGCIKRWEVKLG